MKARFTFHPSIAEIPSEDWDSLTAGKGIFLSHRFLRLLEETGCVGRETGWLPAHLMLRDEADAPLAVMPLYVKDHSWGEYVFDWSWAQAWRQMGLAYYPKLVSAVPMTPAMGPRLCIAPMQPQAEVMRQVLGAVGHLADRLGASGWHLLFPAGQEAQAWGEMQIPVRSGCHFHWFNRGYSDFDDFLAGFTSRARKSLRRERRRVREQGLNLQRVPGTSATEFHWHCMYQFYRQTCAIRGSSGYLNKEFFLRLGEEMADSTVLVIASEEARPEAPVAGALCLYDDHALYGRYWGAARDYDCLHFEACYYQGIEFCIERNLQLFDPGAQGEHKVKRGFEPVLIRSAHWLREEKLRPAVRDFCRRESEAVEHYSQQCRQLLPFRMTQRV